MCVESPKCDVGERGCPFTERLRNQICGSHLLAGHPKLREASDSSSYDNTAYEHFGRIWKLFASALHILQTEFDGFANIGERFRNRLALRIAPRNRRASYDIPSVPLIGLQEDFVVACDHGRIVSHRIECHNDMYLFCSIFEQFHEATIDSMFRKMKKAASIARYGLF